MFETILGFALIAFLVKQFKRWKAKRQEAEFVHRTLKVGAGLNYVPPKATPEHDWTQDVQC